MGTQRTQVGIIGAGPAGLMLAHLMRLAGVDTVVLESRTRDYCENRVRAGLLEQGSVDLMDEVGASDRLHREALVHNGIHVRYDGRSHRVSIKELTGKSMYIYGQQESVKGLIALHLAAGGDVRFEFADVSIEALDDDRPELRYVDAAGNAVRITCDFVAGCDGFHGVSRPSIPAGVLQTYDRPYPFAWLGILTESPPIDPELIYVHHRDGFALFTMRPNSNGSEEKLNAYSDTALRRVWGAARFSWWMTSLTHHFNDRLDFDNVVQLSELQYITSSRAGAETLAEQYVGLPIER